MISGLRDSPQEDEKHAREARDTRSSSVCSRSLSSGIGINIKRIAISIVRPGVSFAPLTGKEAWHVLCGSAGTDAAIFSRRLFAKFLLKGDQ